MSQENRTQAFTVLFYGMIPISTLILATNIPVIFSIILNSKLRIPTFYFVLSLGFADLCVGLTCMASLISQREQTYELCLIRIAFLVSPVCASLCFMFLIALDRYIAVLSALTYHQVMTPVRACLSIAVVCLYATLIGFAPVFGWNKGRYPVICSFLYVVHPNYVWFAYFLGFMLPLVSNIVTYVAIFRVARKHIRQIHTLQASVNRVSSDAARPHTRSLLKSAMLRLSQNLGQMHSFKGTMKALKTLMIVLGSFILTWGPFTTAVLAQAICGRSCDVRELAGTYLLLLGVCNSFCNPIIYAYWNKDFRGILISTCKLCLRYRKRKSARLSDAPVISITVVPTHS